MAMRVRIRSKLLVAPRDGPKDFEFLIVGARRLEGLDEVGISWIWPS